MMLLRYILPELAESVEPSPVPALILVVVNAILEVFCLCLVGYILARKGIVDDKAKKVLNRVNVTLFTPALLFSKVAFTLTPAKLQELTVIPIGFVIISVFSTTVSYILAKIFRLKPGQRNFAIACSMFQNSNSLPIALMQSLIGEKMPLSWGTDDSKDEMLGRALTYLVLFSTLGIIVRWSIGVKLLTSAEKDVEIEASLEEDEIDSEDSELGEREAALHNNGTTHPEGSPLLGNDRRTKLDSKTVTGLSPANKHLSLVRNRSSRKRPQSIFQSFPNSRQVSEAGSDGEDEAERGLHSGQDEWGSLGLARREEDGPESALEERWASIKRKCAKGAGRVGRFCSRINDFMTVPLWAALLSLFVACTPPLQRTLHDVEPLKAALRNAGNCSVPITLVTLGAYFYRPEPPLANGEVPSKPPVTGWSRFNLLRSHEETRRTGSEIIRDEERRRASQVPGETRTVLVAVVSRMILTPLFLLPLFAWYAAATSNVADDPVFIVVACLLIGSPTAITLAQITSSASGDIFEKLISRTLFISYAILTGPCTIGLVLAALYIAKYD